MGFGKDNKGAMIREGLQTMTLGALASQGVVKQDSVTAITEDFRILKSEYFLYFEGHTAGEGPIFIAMVNGELSTTEIAEALQLAGPLDRNDRDGVEKSERLVLVFGILDSNNTRGLVKGLDGQEGGITLKPRWTFGNNDGWSLAAFNQSGGALTTGTIIRFSAKHFGVWVT